MHRESRHITGRVFCIPHSKKLNLPEMFADELCLRLRERYGLPFRAFWDATNDRLFTIAIHPDERNWEGWEVVSRGVRYDRMFLTELHTAVVCRNDIELYLEQQYIEIGNTFVLAWVVVQRRHA